MPLTNFPFGVSSYGMPVMGGGQFVPVHPEAKTFFVSPSNNPTPGSDAFEGSADAPFATIQKGIDACRDNYGDRVVILRGSFSVTTSINFNKSGIIVSAQDYGISPQGKGEFFDILAAASYTDGPVAVVTKRCRIEGLAFVSRDTGATFFSGAALLIGGAAPAGGFGIHIRGCRFPKWGLSNRIGIAIAGGAAVSECLIEGNFFEGVTQNFASGIYVQGAVQNLNIIGNRFRQCTYAITFGAFAGGGGPHCMIGHNVCEDSKLLNSGGNTADGLIYDNWLETATNATSYDGTVSALQGQGLNFSGNHYSE